MYSSGIQLGFINRLKKKRRKARGEGPMPPMNRQPLPSAASQVDMNVGNARNKNWRKRQGSTRYNSFMSHPSEDSMSKQATPMTPIADEPMFADTEEEFLHAAEFGDIHNVKKILNEHVDLNVDCIDGLGRTALRLAVKNEHLEVVEVLIERSSQHHISEAVLQAISAGHTQIAETILKHRRYLEMWKERRKLGDTDGFYKTAFADSQFSPDITPLILASQKNQYEIVQLLLLRGETVMKPHKFSCGCQECRNRMKFDQLRLAKYRLNAYRGLASEAYISLSSKDPILTAFELAAELRRLSSVEKHFKSEYRDLADQLSDYVVKLLDRIRTQKELELVLNKAGKPNQEKYSSLARFKMALQFKEKKFIAHPSCQQRVVRTWYNGMGKLERASWTNRLFMTSLFICSYPFLVFLHVLCPGTKAAKVLQYPVVKFLCHAMSFMAFLLLVIVTTIESSNSVSKHRTLSKMYGNEFKVYTDFCKDSNNTVYGADFPLRASFPSFTEIMMSLWIVGMIFQECNQLAHSGFVEHVTNLYNLQDFLLVSVYTATFTLKYWCMYKFHQAIYYLADNNVSDEDRTLEHLYWLNADRIFWKPTDPTNFLEGIFAINNIFSFSRISYLLPANEMLGPLKISLGRMLKDIAKFGALFVLVILAFMVGLHNLFWYYSERKEIELYLPDRPDSGEVKAEFNFGGVLATFRTVFWSLFGRGEPEAVELGGYNNTFTEDIGYIIYGGYNIVMVTVLLNMLIAMMTRSFTCIAEDSDREWKFARSLLYMDYITKGGTLPPPLNIIGAPKAVLKFFFCQCCCCGDKDDDEEELEEIDEPPPMHPRRGKAAAMNSGFNDFKNSPVRKQASLEGGGSAHPNDDISAVELYEANGRVNPGFEGTPTRATPSKRAAVVNVEMEEETLTYQQTMQRIVQRYIFDIQREAEVTEDDFEEIKQDISSFRYDLINQMTTKQAVEEDLKNSMATVMKQLQAFKLEILGKNPESAENAEGEAAPATEEGAEGGESSNQAATTTPEYSSFADVASEVIEEDPAAE